MIVNLNNAFIDNQGSSVTTGGSWSVDDSSLPVTLIGNPPNSFNTDGLDPGTYVFNYTTTNDCGTNVTMYSYTLCNTPQIANIPVQVICTVNGTSDNYEGPLLNISDSNGNPFNTPCAGALRLQLLQNTIPLATAFAPLPVSQVQPFGQQIGNSGPNTQSFVMEVATVAPDGTVCSNSTTFQAVYNDNIGANSNTFETCSPPKIFNLWDAIGFDPNDYENGTTATWIAPDGTVINNPSTFNLSAYNAGTHIFTLEQNFENCSYTATLTIVISENSAGTSNSITHCQYYD